eukprot:jgi/Mesvir1/18355/Mv14251-RA.1
MSEFRQVAEAPQPPAHGSLFPLDGFQIGMWASRHADLELLVVEGKKQLVILVHHTGEGRRVRDRIMVWRKLPNNPFGVAPDPKAVGWRFKRWRRKSLSSEGSGPLPSERDGRPSDSAGAWSEAAAVPAFAGKEGAGSSQAAGSAGMVPSALSSQPSAGSVYAYEFGWGDIVGMDYCAPLCDFSRVVLEMKLITRRDFPCAHDAYSYYGSGEGMARLAVVAAAAAANAAASVALVPSSASSLGMPKIVACARHASSGSISTSVRRTSAPEESSTVPYASTHNPAGARGGISIALQATSGAAAAVAAGAGAMGPSARGMRRGGGGGVHGAPPIPAMVRTISEPIAQESSPVVTPMAGAQTPPYPLFGHPMSPAMSPGLDSVSGATRSPALDALPPLSSTRSPGQDNGCAIVSTRSPMASASAARGNALPFQASVTPPPSVPASPLLEPRNGGGACAPCMGDGRAQGMQGGNVQGMPVVGSPLEPAMWQVGVHSATRGDTCCLRVADTGDACGSGCPRPSRRISLEGCSLEACVGTSFVGQVASVHAHTCPGVLSSSAPSGSSSFLGPPSTGSSSSLMTPPNAGSASLMTPPGGSSSSFLMTTVTTARTTTAITAVNNGPACCSCACQGVQGHRSPPCPLTSGHHSGMGAGMPPPPATSLLANRAAPHASSSFSCLDPPHATPLHMAGRSSSLPSVGMHPAGHATTSAGRRVGDGSSNGPSVAASSWPAPDRWTVRAASYRNKTAIFTFSDPHLPCALRAVVEPNEVLLKLYEGGLPSWAVFLPSYGLYYRPCFRKIFRLFIILLSIFSMACGFYDLYKNIPYARETLHAFLGPLIEWFEEHASIRLSILLTFLFSKSQLFHSVLRFLRATWTYGASFFAVVLAPLRGPALLLSAAASSTFALLASCGEYVAEIGETLLRPLALAGYQLLLLLRSAASALGVVFALPIALISGLARSLATVGSSLVQVVLALWGTLAHLGRLAAMAARALRLPFLSSSSAVTASGVRAGSAVGYKLVSEAGMRGRDLFPQLWRGVRPILHGTVAFSSSVNRHRLSLYNSTKRAGRRMRASVAHAFLAAWTAVAAFSCALPGVSLMGHLLAHLLTLATPWHRRAHGAPEGEHAVPEVETRYDGHGALFASHEGVDTEVLEEHAESEHKEKAE